jgi:hypothetical protein
MNDLHYAVVVGINAYPALRPLSSARGDAERFREWLVSPTGGDLPPENVKLIVASKDEETEFRRTRDARPKRAEVDEALQEINEAVSAKVEAEPDDRERARLYFFGAGHGIAPQGGESALLMADARPGVFGFNIEVSLYTKWYVERGLFREIVVFSDCCRERIDSAPPATGPPFDVSSRPLGSTIHVLGYATQLAELAFEPRPNGDPDAERGYFTKALLDGLDSPTTVDPTIGRVTAMTLATYVRQAVEDLTKNEDVPQKVQVLGDLTEPIVFGPARGLAPEEAPHSRAVTILLPAGFTGTATLRRGDLSVVETHDAAAGAWELQLPEGLYQVVADGREFKERGQFQVIGDRVDVEL